MIVEEIENELMKKTDETQTIKSIIYNYFIYDKYISNFETLKKEFEKYYSIYYFFRKKAYKVNYCSNIIELEIYLYDISEIFFNSLKISNQLNEYLIGYKLTKLMCGGYNELRLNPEHMHYLVIVGDFELPCKFELNPPEFIKKYSYTNTKWEAK